MAWVLVTGEDVQFYHNAIQKVRRAGHDVVAAPDGPTALRLLGDIARARGLVVLLRPRMGQMDVGAFLGAVAVDDDLRWRHAYILLDGAPGRLSPDVDRYVADLAVQVTPTPGDLADADGWADLLDEIELAAQRLSARAGPTVP